MKNYVLVLEPDEPERERIVALRSRLFGSPLVDAMPPHLTLIGRFTLKPGGDETALQEVVRQLSLNAQSGTFAGISRIGTAIVANIDSPAMIEMHKTTLKNLLDTITQVRPEREGDNFHPHVTIGRSEPDFPINEQDLPRQFTFPRLCLYEIDPSTTKTWSRKISCRELA